MNELKGIIINSIDYKEKSKIVYLYTPYGHDSVKANQSKDFKKGLLGFTTTLNEVSFIKTKSKFPTLVEYNVINNNFDITQSVDILEVVFKILEIIKAVPEESDHERIYKFLVLTIENLKKYNPKKILTIFLIKMLHAFGINPNLKSCVKCSSNDIKFLSIDSGECYCSKCSTLNNFDTYKIWFEYYYSKKEIDEFTDTDFDSILLDLYNYYSKYADIYLKNCT